VLLSGSHAHQAPHPPPPRPPRPPSQHVNSGCCFDYGNAESDPTNSSTFHDGTMESINFSVTDVTGTWCGGAGHTGPWVMADLENGLWACGGNMTQNANNIPLPFPFVTAMVKGGVSGFALKGGDATAPGNLTLLYDGPRPPGYQPMRKQGAIILGMGGDNVSGRRKAAGNRPTPSQTGLSIPTTAIGTFFEGCMTSGYSTDAADAALQADIVAAGYGS
jgi:non-reducing end alpha-L-arabinofuranosidase